MSSTYGQNLKLSLFGQSHGKAVGMVLDGVSAGLPVDLDRLQAFLDRRRPGLDELTSPRKEADRAEILSGIVDGYTCGAPIAATIANSDRRSQDYDPDLPRPGHADLTARAKFGPYADCNGGGHFSGRLTAPLCVAGGLCLQWLEAMGISIGAHIIQIGEEKADRFDPLKPQLSHVGQIFPTLTAEDADRLRTVIAAAKAEGDSVGGRIECAVVGLPAGLGEPMFDGVENRLARILYAIPAVKAVGFGRSEEFAALRGHESNDPFGLQDGRIVTETNNCGGILGGITTGMPVLFDVTVKPTASIAQPQQTVSLRDMRPTTLCVQGRHDPCIVPRAVAAVEAAAAIAVYDLILSDRK